MTEYKNLEPSTNSKYKNDFSKNIIIVILAIALLFSIGYIVYSKRVYSKSSMIMQVNINDLERSREILKQELRIVRADFDETKNKASKNDIILSNQDKLILRKQKEIQSILIKEGITSDDLYRAKRLIVSLESDINFYKEELTKLKNENVLLTSKNYELENKNTTLIDRNKLIESNLTEERKNKENLLEEANSTLSISNYTISGLIVRSSGKEIESNRASRISKVRVTFDLDKNLNTDSGKKELFVTILKPSGEIGKFKGSTSGEMTLRSGLKVDYSDRVTVDYNNMSGSRISFDWIDYKFLKGEYKIDIYQNGYKLGQNIIVFK